MFAFKGAFGSFAGAGPALPSEDSREVNAFGCFASCFGFRASNATVGEADRLARSGELLVSCVTSEARLGKPSKRPLE